MLLAILSFRDVASAEKFHKEVQVPMQEAF